MTGLGDRSLGAFLDDVAATTPAPGGGSSAALTTALAAALVEMSAGIAEAAEEHGGAAAVRARALELAEEELASYEPVLAAQRLPLGEERSERLAVALAEASRAPAEIADLAAETAELGARVAATASPAVRGDAVTGTLLAEAAATAAATLVETNLRDQPDDPALTRATDARKRARRARVEVA